MTLPYQNSPAAIFISARIQDLAYRKSQAEIAAETGFQDIPEVDQILIGAVRGQLLDFEPLDPPVSEI